MTGTHAEHHGQRLGATFFRAVERAREQPDFGRIRVSEFPKGITVRLGHRLIVRNRRPLAIRFGRTGFGSGWSLRRRLIGHKTSSKAAMVTSEASFCGEP